MNGTIKELLDRRRMFRDMAKKAEARAASGDKRAAAAEKIIKAATELLEDANADVGEEFRRAGRYMAIANEIGLLIKTLRKEAVR